MSVEPSPTGGPNEGGARHVLDDASIEWLRAGGPAGDVVFSSRVRLARNLSGLPFVGRATPEQKQRTLDLVREAIRGTDLPDRWVWLNIHETPASDRGLLVERHLISKQLQKGRGAAIGEDPRAVAFCTPGERVSIMVNEEDHLRLQVIRSGLDLSDAWAQADRIDDSLEAALDFAYAPRLGYLTACPTNIGTGARMSVMLHLPALRMTGDIDKVKRAAGDMGLAVRGFYGEGSEAAGDLYQLSNQTTLGKTEAMILSDLESVIIPRVIEYERIARKTLLTKRTNFLLDQIYRSLGAARHARLMTAEEAMQHLSNIRMGCILGVIKDVEPALLNLLLLLVQPTHLQRVFGKDLDQDARREARALLLRTRLGGV